MLALSEGNVKFGCVGDGDGDDNGEDTARRKRDEGTKSEGNLTGVNVGTNKEAEALSDLDGE